MIWYIIFAGITSAAIGFWLGMIYSDYNQLRWGR
jgi:hypothetical protein